jgi:hypothetical protein
MKWITLVVMLFMIYPASAETYRCTDNAIVMHLNTRPMDAIVSGGGKQKIYLLNRTYLHQGSEHPTSTNEYSDGDAHLLFTSDDAGRNKPTLTVVDVRAGEVAIHLWCDKE